MQLKFVLCMIKYKIKRKIVNCEKIESVTSHDLYPLPCHKLSHFLKPLPPLERDILYGRPLWLQEIKEDDRQPDLMSIIHYSEISLCVRLAPGNNSRPIACTIFAAGAKHQIFLRLAKIYTSTFK